MKNTHLALAAFAVSIICAAGAAYSAPTPAPSQEETEALLDKLFKDKK